MPDETACYPDIVNVTVTNEGGTMPVRGENGEELLTTAETADALGLSASTVRVLVARGRLGKVLLSPRSMFIPREDIERYKRESLGKPPGRKSEEPTKAAAYSRAYRERKKAVQQGQDPADSSTEE